MGEKAKSGGTPVSQRWGIYYADQEYARLMGNPLRTVVEAPTKPAAEELAAQFGFGDGCACLVTAGETANAQWLPATQLNRKSNPKATRGIATGNQISNRINHLEILDDY